MDINKLYNRTSEIINSNDNFLIITHVYPDGDSLGSQIALYQLISLLKKNAVAICNSELPYQYKFLPYLNEIRRDLEEIENCGKGYICFCLDCADEYRMNLDFKVLKDNAKYIINIDHHKNNTNFGNLNIVDTGKSATAEILYELIHKHYRELLNHGIALGIYVGILTDTGKFQYSNTNYAVHKVISDLLKFNLYPSQIHKYIYENEPLARFKLIQLILQRIKYVDSYRLIYSYVLEKDFKKLDLPFSAQDGAINLLRSAEKVRVAALIKQTARKSFKISLRTSDKKIDLFKVASSFNGGGHRMASAYSDNGSLRTVISNLRKVVKDNINYG
ncbi:MAG TPA: bifunctional oligoribonuclease/PAP phosphatase NrnA [Candidatus Hydromicrobium sp.]